MHLSEEQLVLHHYHDDDAPAAAEQHLGACAECRAEYQMLRRVLAVVSEAPAPERGEQYGAEVWNRLRWKLGRQPRVRRAVWIPALATAAVLAIVFMAGALWHSRTAPHSGTPMIAETHTAAAGTQVAATSQNTLAQGDRFLVVVVSDHLDSTERMLLEVANADPKKSLDTSASAKRAEELVASNRIFRQTASQRGDARIASVLSDIEPVLLELSHAGNNLTADELSALQKRIESRGLLLKVRVTSAKTGETEAPPMAKGTSSL
jgi:hypothetical protein